MGSPGAPWGRLGSLLPPELEAGISDSHDLANPETAAEVLGGEVDYYGILGLEPDCDSDDVRRAYRGLSKRNASNESQDELQQKRLKLVTEAYSVLSDPVRRVQYDTGALHQTESVTHDQLDSPKGVANRAFNILGNLLRTVPAGSHPQGIFQHGYRGTAPACVEKTLLVSLPELIRGARKCFTVCDASGKNVVLQVDLTPGWREGTRISFPGKGGPGVSPSDPPRDLVFILKETPHELYKRDGDDLTVDMKIPLVTALCGGQVELPAFAGRPPLSMTINSGDNLDVPFFVSGWGMPRSDGYGTGNLRVHFQVELPRSLTGSQRAQLREILEQPSL
ncbi:chaperone protein DnaJ 2-like [Convolutriloba macropyga]|uniref:chaperone protein DnaJ 2-like n=1 Tax=Convolutriloba macropyga TaxID=536237 RepID=UPI003F520944